MKKFKIWNLLLNIITIVVLIRKSSGWNRQAYEYSRQSYEYAQEQWRFQLESERRDHEEYQEDVTQNNDKLMRDIEDGNRKIQEGDEDFHEKFEDNREKGTPGAAFAKRSRSAGKRAEIRAKKKIVQFVARHCCIASCRVNVGRITTLRATTFLLYDFAKVQ